jgi:hypothetical protein
MSPVSQTSTSKPQARGALPAPDSPLCLPIVDRGGGREIMADMENVIQRLRLSP